MKRIILIFISTLFLFFFNGCEGGGYLVVGDEKYYPIEIKYTLYSGVNEYITEYVEKREILIIKNEDDFERIYGYYNPNKEIPYIDFDRYEVIAVIDSIRNSGGYFIDIKKIKEYEDYILVEITYQKPGEGCIVPQVLTQPFIFIKIKKSDKVVKLKEIEEIYSCSI